MIWNDDQSIIIFKIELIYYCKEGLIWKKARRLEYDLLCAQRTITLWMPFIGFIYPVVTHWAWSSGGWLTVGDSYAALNNEVVAYQVFKHPCIDKNFKWTSYCGNTQCKICRKVNWGLSVNPYDEPIQRKLFTLVTYFFLGLTFSFQCTIWYTKVPIRAQNGNGFFMSKDKV